MEATFHRPSTVDGARQQFWLSILTYLSLLIDYVDEENFIWLETAINFVNIVIDIDYPGQDIDIYSENLQDAYNWYHGAQNCSIENIRQRILLRIIDFLGQEMAASAGFRLQSIHSAVQNLQNLLDLEQAAGDYEDMSDLLMIYFKYRAYILNMTGNQLVELNFLPGAVGEYTHAINLDPTNVDYYCNRASAYIALKLYAAAAADCQEAIDMDSNCARGYALLGKSHYQRGWFVQSRNAYRSALLINPGNAQYIEYLKLAEVQLFPKMTPLPPQGIDVDDLLRDAGFTAILGQISPDPEIITEGTVLRYTDLIRQSSAGGYADYVVLMNRLNRALDRQSRSHPELLAYIKQRVFEQQPSTSAQAAPALEPTPSTSGLAMQQKTPSVVSDQTNPSTSSQGLEEDSATDCTSAEAAQALEPTPSTSGLAVQQETPSVVSDQNNPSASSQGLEEDSATDCTSAETAQALEPTPSTSGLAVEQKTPSVVSDQTNASTSSQGLEEVSATDCTSAQTALALEPTPSTSGLAVQQKTPSIVSDQNNASTSSQGLKEDSATDCTSAQTALALEPTPSTSGLAVQQKTPSVVSDQNNPSTSTQGLEEGSATAGCSKKKIIPPPVRDVDDSDSN